MIWRTWVAHASGSPSQRCWYAPKERKPNAFGTSSAAEAAGRVSIRSQIRLRGFTQVFSFGVDSLSLSYPLGDHKAVVLLTHSWGSVHEHQGIFHSSVGLHTACLGTDLLRVLVVQPGVVRCPVSSIATRRHYIGLVKGRLCTGRERLTHSALLFTLLLASGDS